ncbi:hypothetical protein PK35_04090 [Tamlana nanhaiensis]|uniref:DUF3861 domain-containing protein n=1 Tax=Neotamlana nanhaiensis TaxID=1382798 RepID=A0A0D7W4H3_9FLAO|nr:DUF3861 domain-containing protein [Tamlana nanhaiensis]KJD33924.1 hypothetical protein PK35_04090 [Tamlana nanhaiensis]
MKKNNKYKIDLQEIALKDETSQLKDISFEFENHDDIFKIIDLSKEKNLFDNANDSVEFTLGLKLFSEVMIKHRKHDLFEDFLPHFKTFMQTLKSQ